MDSARASALFRRLSADLENLDKEAAGIVRCPLCLRTFNIDGLSATDNKKRLTVEHIVHNALGGCLSTLTCWECNNKAGTTIDPHFINAVRSSNALAGSGRAMPGKMEIRGVEVPVHVTLTTSTDGTPQWGMKIPGVKPEHIASVMQSLKADLKEFKVSFSLKYNERKRRLSQLRGAYLAAFHFCGYQWVLSEAADVVRQVVSGEVEPPGRLGRSRGLCHAGQRKTIISF